MGKPSFRRRQYLLIGFQNRMLLFTFLYFVGTVVIFASVLFVPLMRNLDAEGLSENTIVIFTSDNGPWLEYGDMGGSAGLLRAGKGTTFEGGMRVPTIIWGPGTAKPEVVTDPGGTLGLLHTFCSLAAVDLPADRVYDGGDLSARIRGTGPSPRKSVFYYRGDVLYAVRNGPWKMHFRSRPRSGAK